MFREHAHNTFLCIGNSIMCMIMYTHLIFGFEYVCACACMHWPIYGGYMFCVFVLFPVIVYIHICKHNYLLHKHCMIVLLRAFTNSRSIMSVLGVCTRKYRFSTLIVRVCAVSVHIRIHHAPTLCVCVFYACLCIGNAHTHT